KAPKQVYHRICLLNPLFQGIESFRGFWIGGSRFLWCQFLVFIVTASKLTALDEEKDGRRVLSLALACNRTNDVLPSNLKKEFWELSSYEIHGIGQISLETRGSNKHNLENANEGDCEEPATVISGQRTERCFPSSCVGTERAIATADEVPCGGSR